RGRENSIQITAIADAEAVSYRIDHTCANTGKCRCGRTRAAADATHRGDEIEYVISQQRKIAHFRSRQNLADGSRRFANCRIDLSRDVDGLSCRAHLHGEVVTDDLV